MIGEYTFNDLQNQLAYAEQLEQKGTFSDDYMEMISDLEKEKVRNEATFVKNFLESSSQFTPTGLFLLSNNLPENEVCFFSIIILLLYLLEILVLCIFQK